MSPFETLLIVIVIILFVLLFIDVVLPFFKRKGVDIEAVLKRANDVFVAAGNALETVRPFLPEEFGTDALDKIIKAAQVGVGKAEQLFIIGQLAPEKRKEEARKFITDAVTLAGVVVTPEVERLIDGVIESEVLKLGHALKPTDEASDPLPVDLTF